MLRLSCRMCVPLLLVSFLATTSQLRAEDDEADPLIMMVVELLADQDRDIRALGLDQVRDASSGSTATRLFAAQLPKLSAEAQVGLLRALADRGDVAARDSVLELLGATSEADVLVAALEAIGSLGTSEDTALLLENLSSDSKARRDAAHISLVKLSGDDVSQRMAGALAESSTPVRIAILDILTTRRARDTFDEVLRAAIDDDPKVRQAAMASLGELGGPEQLSGMVAGVLKAQPGAERAAAEKNIMFVCARIEDPDRRAEPLLAAMDQLGGTDRLVLLPTLGRVGGPAVLEIVTTAIADPDPKTHQTGVSALCNWPDATVVPQLLELVNSDEHTSHQIAALRALIRVAPVSDDRTDAQRLALLQQAMELSQREEERKLVLKRAQAVRTIESLRFVLSYCDTAPLAEQACESVVELAHHRGLRQPNKAEFHQALDKVIATTKDPVLVERSERYKRDETWVRPKK